MLLQAITSAGLRLPPKIFQCSAKKYSKFFLFLTAPQLMVCRNFSVSLGADFLQDINVQKYLNYIASKAGSKIYGEKQADELRSLLKKKEELESEMKNLESMSSEGDKELEKLIETEKQECLESYEQTKNEILDNILPRNDNMDDTNVEVIIKPGIGGEEARLFGQELLNMYENYAKFKNWEYIKDENNLLVKGDDVFGFLKQEAGVHRVQRVPATETTGRTHTSTVSVVVLLQRKLQRDNVSKDDLIIEKKRSSAPGGQNVNKRESAIRITHKATGIKIESQTQRFQKQNLDRAKKVLTGILFLKNQKEIISERKNTAKEQVGINDYSDKIRTYHFQQNRVTDHRINYTFGNVRVFMTGQKQLDDVIIQVRRLNLTKELLDNVQNTLMSEEYKEFEKAQTG